MSSNADLCARCGYARRVHIRSGFSGGSLHCPTMTFVEPSTLSPTSRTLCVDGEGVARIQDYPQPSTPSPDAGAPGAEGRLLCPVCGEHWNYNPNRPGAEAMAYNAYAMHSIGHRMAAQPPQRPGAQPEAKRYGCYQCGTQYTHEPIVLRRDRLTSLLFCSPGCRSTYRPDSLSPLPVDQHPGAPGAETP